MGNYTAADWIFIAGVMAVIFFFVGLSGMMKNREKGKTKGEHPETQKREIA